MSAASSLTIVLCPVALIAQMFPPGIDARLPFRNGLRVDSGPLDAGPVFERLPERAANPTSATVSLRELLHPISPKAVRAFSEALRFAKRNDIPRAIQKLEQAVRISPCYRDAHNNLGVQYARAGRMAEAQAEFRQAIAIGPASPFPYTNLALTYAALGDVEGARQCARKALEIDPNDSLARDILAAKP